jgi:hypothetical protein
MNYQQAKETRRTSLFKLIAEKKFEGDQSLGASIGGAISDKFKAKAIGFKESIDPLNFTRKIFGKGLIGDAAVTGLGRLFGRKESDIANFGGFRSKKRSKDPRYSTISAGPVLSLRMGDSSADILGKMYNFMVFTGQRNRLTDDIEKNFRQEQLDEDNRRHKALVEAIKGFTKNGKGVTAKRVEKKNEESDNGIDLAAWAAALLASLRGFLSKFTSFFPIGKPPPLGKVGNNPSKISFATGTSASEKISATMGKGMKGREPFKPPEKTKTYTERKERTASRAMPKPEQPKSTATKVKVSKAWQMAKTAGSFGNNLALKGVGTFLNLLSSGPLKVLAIGYGLWDELTQLYDDLVNKKISEEEGTKRLRVIAGRAVGGWYGASFGSALGAQIGTVGGPWGVIIGAAAGGTAGYLGGDYLAGVLTEYLITDKLPEARVAIEYAKEKGFVIGEEGAAFGTQVKGVKKRDVLMEPKSSTLPLQISSQMGLSAGEEVVQVNNTTNNVGGEQPKVVSLNTPRTRNIDLERYIKNSSAIV